MNKHFARTIFLISCVLPFSFRCLHADEAASGSGIMRVTVEDIDGQKIKGAHLYLFDQEQKQFVKMPDVDGFASLTVRSGHYLLYAALTRDNHGYIEHYSSPETGISLSPDDNISVILRLEEKKVDNNVDSLSQAIRHKIGLSDGDEAAPTQDVATWWN